MAEPLMDFECHVGKYEIRRYDELPENARSLDYHDAPNMPYLLQVGPGRLIRPKPDFLRAAVGHLLQTRMPRWHAAMEKRWKWTDPIDFDPEELSLLKRNVLLITRHIGMLNEFPEAKHGFDPHESLEKWVDLAQWIQKSFAVFRDIPGDLVDVPIGPLRVFLSRRHRQPISMHIRPLNTHDALIYAAAREIARGTAVQTCDNCSKPFLEGGVRDSRSKKRAGSRFCSDRCRWEYHNEVRRKAKAKS